MHRDHDHDHHHHRPHASANGERAELQNPSMAGLGHNHAHTSHDVAQWQTPHRDPNQAAGGDHTPGESDLDQVAAAFVEGFLSASNPMSFLRLANVPFEMTDHDTKLVLLRVETDVVADVGSITPHLGGRSFRYDPLPAPLISHRRRLRFIYFDGTAPRSLTYSEVRRHAALNSSTPID